MAEASQHEEFEHESWPWEIKYHQGWQANFELLKEYVREFETIPTRSTMYRGAKLGVWAAAQRQAVKGQGNCKMTPERKQALETVPGWFWEKDPEQEWKANLELMKEYVQEFEKLPTSRSEYRGVKIGSWMDNQRKAAKGHQSRGKMTPERKQALEEVPGWVWEKDLNQEWQVNCDLLKEYIQEFGKLPAQKTEYCGVNIGTWVDTQRRAAKGIGRYKMTLERKQALDAVPGWKWW